MPRDEDDELFDGEFDFVDDDEFEGDADEDSAEEAAAAKPVKKRKTAKKKTAKTSTTRKKKTTEAKKKAPKKKAPKKKKVVEEVEEEPLVDEEEPVVEAEQPADEAPDATGTADGDQPAAAEAAESAESESDGDEYGRVEPKTDYVVHVYEHTKFLRTLAREFTPEDADAFATVFNKTGRAYGRFAVPAKNDAPPQPELTP